MMRQQGLCVTIILLFFVCGVHAQKMTVKDNDSNVLMEVNDEGTTGSITLLPGNRPDVTTNKLYNVGSTLFWEDSALGNNPGSDFNTVYVPYLLEQTGFGAGAYNGDVLIMNPTAFDIDVVVTLYELDGTSLISPESLTLGSGETTIISVEALLGVITGTQVCYMMVTSTDPNFSRVFSLAMITCFLPDGGTTSTVYRGFERLVEP